MLFCPFCGSKINFTYIYCYNCGKQLNLEFLFSQDKSDIKRSRIILLKCSLIKDYLKITKLSFTGLRLSEKKIQLKKEMLRALDINLPNVIPSWKLFSDENSKKINSFLSPFYIRYKNIKKSHLIYYIDEEQYYTTLDRFESLINYINSFNTDLRTSFFYNFAPTLNQALDEAIKQLEKVFPNNKEAIKKLIPFILKDLFDIGIDLQVYTIDEYHLNDTFYCSFLLAMKKGLFLSYKQIYSSIKTIDISKIPLPVKENRKYFSF